MQETSKAVGIAARLKPEIRLARAISEFSSCLDNDSQRIKFKNLQSRSFPSSSDIITFVEELNRDGSRLHRSWKPYATRLVGLLDRMRQFAPVGDVLVGGSQNLLACGVWAALRLSLELSVSVLSYFDRISAFLLRAGRLSTIHEDMTALYPGCRKLQTYMCEYVIVMVEICRKVVTYAQKSSLSQIPLAMSFETSFKSLENDLQLWGNLIEKRTSVLSQQSNLEARDSVLERLDLMQRKREKDAQHRSRELRRHALLSVLSPDQSEFETTWRRERRRGTSDWILKSQPYLDWLESPISSTLWLKGNLGSGKTVTMANVIGNLNMLKKHMSHTITYFFCKSDSLKTLRADTIMGSIAFQVLEDPKLKDNLASYLDQAECVLAKKRPSVEECVDMLLAVTPRTWNCFLVLDGLEECEGNELSELFENLARLMQARKVLLMGSSRPAADALATLSRFMRITYLLSMDHVDRNDDVERLISAEIDRWKTIRRLGPGLEQLVKKQLLLRSQGMFLWLALQLESICPKYTNFLRSDAEILDMINNLPRTINEAFDRALLRIKDERYGSRIFQLVTSADPALSLDELRIAVNVVPGTRDWNTSTVIHDGVALLSYYGGSLLDFDEEDSKVRFIHHSALSYLVDKSPDPAVSRFHFDFPMAETTMGLTCITYLNYGVFDSRVSRVKKLSLSSIPEAAISTSLNSRSLARKVISIMTNSKASPATEADLERLQIEIQTSRKHDDGGIHAFLEYATSHWLQYTKRISVTFKNASYLLFESLIKGDHPAVKLPWDPDQPSSGMTWSITNSHLALFRYFIASPHRHALSSILDHFANVEPDGFRFYGEEIADLPCYYLLSDLSEKLTTLKFLLQRLGPYVKPQTDVPQPFDPKCNLEFSVNTLSTRASTMLFQALIKDLDHRFQFDDVLDFLFDCASPPAINAQQYGRSLLFTAIHTGHEKIASGLLLKGSIHSGKGKGDETLLQAALRMKMPRLAQQLIDHGAFTGWGLFSNKVLPPLYLAIDIPDANCVKRLIAIGAHDRDYRREPTKQTALHFACWKYHETEEREALYDVLNALLDDNAIVNVRNVDGETSLMILVKSYIMSTNSPWNTDYLRRTTIQAINLLLSRPGINPNIGDSSGVTPLMVAAYQHAPEIVETLLNSGALPNICISGQMNSLHLASLRGESISDEDVCDHLPLDDSFNLPQDATALAIALGQVKPFLDRLSGDIMGRRLKPVPRRIWEETEETKRHYQTIISNLLDHGAKSNCPVDSTATATSTVAEEEKELVEIAGAAVGAAYSNE